MREIYTLYLIMLHMSLHSCTPLRSATGTSGTALLLFSYWRCATCTSGTMLLQFSRKDSDIVYLAFGLTPPTNSHPCQPLPLMDKAIHVKLSTWIPSLGGRTLAEDILLLGSVVEPVVSGLRQSDQPRR